MSHKLRPLMQRLSHVHPEISCGTRLDVQRAFENILNGNNTHILKRQASTMNYLRFLNEFSVERKPSPIREITKMVALSPEPFINFGAGLPNASLYPFESISVTLKDGNKLNIDGSLLSSCLQYGPSEGYPKLQALLKEYQTRLHNPPMHCDWSVIVTAGSQDGLCKAFEMLVSQEDYIISEEYIYAGAAAILKPFKVKHLKVKGDQDGIRPDSLREILKPWNPSGIRNLAKGVPKILYVIPNGSNPVGTSISADRRKEIYKIAQEYNLLILEDDPYYFIQFCKEKLPSFLSMDVDGRVIRFDSFSKLFSGGLRLGFVTGPQPLLQQIILHMQVSVVHSSHAPQFIIHELLKTWGFDKYSQHATSVAKFYESRRDLMLKYAEKWLKGLAEWNIPAAGMFLWIRILGVKDTVNLIKTRCYSKKVVFLPGRFSTIDDSESSYIRVSFSFVTEEEMERGFKSLAEAIKEELNSEKIQ